MKKYNSVMYTILLSNCLSISELPLKNRSDRWWDMFWKAFALSEAKERVR